MRAFNKERPDANEPEIVQALERVGAVVTKIKARDGRKGVPDLLVSYKGAWHVLEVKTPTGKLKTEQMDFIGNSSAIVSVVRNIRQALLAIGVQVA